MSDVFILGAGFSKAVFEEMPTLRELSAKVLKRVSRVEPIHRMFPDNVEMWLTYLSQNHPWLREAESLRNQADLLDIVREIARAIAQSMRTATREQWPDWFGNLVAYWHRNRSVILTLNYDTLIERCVVGQYLFTNGEVSEDKWFWSYLYPVPLTPAAPIIGDLGIAGDPRTVQLFKLHGSVNWFYSGTNSFSGEPIYCLPVDTWKDDSSRLDKGVSASVSGRTPLLIPPLTEKSPYFQNQIVRQIWQRAGNELVMADRVFVLGYSLPETDLTLRFFLAQTMMMTGRPAKFYVADIDRRMVRRLKRAIPKGFDIKERFASPDSPIRRFAKALVAQNLD